MVASAPLAVYIYFKNPKQRINILWSIMCLLVMFWAVCFIVVSAARNESLALWAVRNSYFFAIFIPPVFLHFVVAFLRQDTGRRLKISYAIGVLFAFFCFHPIFVERVRPIASFSFYTKAGPLFYIYTIYFFSLVVYAHIKLFANYYRLDRLRRQQVKIILIGTIVGFSGGSTSFPMCFGIPMDPFGKPLVFLYTVLVSYAVFKHKLMIPASDTARLLDKARLQALGIMSASIHHEIKNPLYVAETVLKKQLDSPGESGGAKMIERIQNALRQIERIKGTVQRYESFLSKKENKSDGCRISFKEVLNEVVLLSQHKFAEGQVELETSVMRNDIFIADSSMLEEVLTNLLINAVNASVPGAKVRLGATLETVGADSALCISVSDQGCGISESEIEKIFEPFHTKSRRDGMGLGLFIVKQLIESRGGYIQVRSRISEGSIFTVFWPVSENSENTEKAEAA